VKEALKATSCTQPVVDDPLEKLTPTVGMYIIPLYFWFVPPENVFVRLAARLSTMKRNPAVGPDEGAVRVGVVPLPIEIVPKLDPVELVKITVTPFPVTVAPPLRLKDPPSMKYVPGFMVTVAPLPILTLQ
jgi:hypothetical protein